jgi:hypothetical protein
MFELAIKHGAVVIRGGNREWCEWMLIDGQWVGPQGIVDQRTASNLNAELEKFRAILEAV